MLGLMRLDLAPERIAKLRKVLHFNGLPIDARSITDGILVQEGRKPVGAGHGQLVTSGRAAGGE
jgi:hypothetical protein